MPVVMIYLTPFIRGSILIALTLFFAVVFYLMELRTLKLIGFFSLAEVYIGSMWFLPYLSTRSFMNVFSIGIGALKFVDHGWAELMGGQGLYLYSSKVASRLDLMNFSNLKFYIFIYFFALLIVVFLLIYLGSLIDKVLH